MRTLHHARCAGRSATLIQAAAALAVSVTLSGCALPGYPLTSERAIPFFAHPGDDACGIQAAQIVCAMLDEAPPPDADILRAELYAPALGGTPLPLLVAFFQDRGYQVQIVRQPDIANIRAALQSPGHAVLAVTAPARPEALSHVSVMTGLRAIPPRGRRHTAERPDVWTSWRTLHNPRRDGDLLLIVSRP